MKLYFRFGSHPNLSLAELEGFLHTSDIKYNTEVIEKEYAILDFKNEVDTNELISELGGTIKIGKIISETKKDEVADELSKTIQDYLDTFEGKVFFGISLVTEVKGLRSSLDIQKLGVKIKKEISKSARFVQSKEKELSSVIVKNEKLLRRGGDFNILTHGDMAYIGVTLAVQDFKEYARRDHGRPAVDPTSGMLPPKLCQMMINIASVPKDAKILDPFCGSGTMLQELLLKGYTNISGSDISEKAISDTLENLGWLEDEYGLETGDMQVERRNVVNISQEIEGVDAIITEPYLGPPRKGTESMEYIDKILRELTELYEKSFKEFEKAVSDDGVIVMIFPVLRFRQEFYYLDLAKITKGTSFKLKTDYKNIEKLEYRYPLMYYREQQKNYREVLVFKKG